MLVPNPDVHVDVDSVPRFKRSSCRELAVLHDGDPLAHPRGPAPSAGGEVHKPPYDVAVQADFVRHQNKEP